MNDVLLLTRKRSARHVPHLRGSINLLVFSFAFGQFWAFMIQSLPMTQLAKFMNMSAFGFGLLGGLFTYGQLAQLFGSYLSERYGHRKPLVIVTSLIARFLWLPIAFFPLMASGNWRWEMLLGLAILSLVFLNLSNPPTVSWVSDLVPGRIMGRFFARRMQIGLITSMIAMLIVSYILDKGSSAGHVALKIALVILFVFSAIAGIAEYVLYIFVLDKPQRMELKRVNVWTILLKPLSDREFICFVFYYCTVALSTVFMGHFMFLFLLDIIGMSNVQITILLTVVSNIIIAVSYPFWGKITDYAGYKPALFIGGLSFVFCSIWLVLATPDNWLIFYLFSTASFFFMPAFETGNAVFMYTKVYGQGKDTLGSSYPAVFGIFIAIGGVLVSVLSGYTASKIGVSWRGSFLGHQLTYHTIIFIIAIGMRLIAFLWLLGVRNTKNFTASKTIRLVFGQAMEKVHSLIHFGKYYIFCRGKL